MLSLRAQEPSAPLTGHLAMGSPHGPPVPLTVDSRRVLRAGRPWIPVMGEFHFSRYPAAEWREELLKMRAGGINLVATYLFWNQHEEQRGAYRFDGDLDIRRFVELCAELGLSVAVRIGPWSHGECRNGGFPDWLAGTECVPRTDDPAYLALVRPYFARIAHELRGLWHRDGGPVIAVQVENELYDQPGHLATLRRMAEEAGADAPLWTATAWGGARIPPDVLLPLYGGYPEAFWEDAHPGWAREMRRHYFFTPVRDDHAIGADLRNAAPAGGPDDRRYPYATCELGGGMAIAYHRRPLVPERDVTALALTKIGSGSVWQGYYLYHGCSQRLEHGVPNQESHATGYPNDLPSVTYDFQAPLGEYGQVRPAYHALRRQHLLLQDAGAELADMPLSLPDAGPGGLDDRTTLRWAVRSRGDTGGSHGRASAPLDADFERASVHHIAVLPEVFDESEEAGEVLLRIQYTGDVARAYIGGKLIADHFWYGPVWEIGLRRFAAEAVRHGIELRILPAARESRLYVDPTARDGLDAARARTSVDAVSLLPLRRLTLRAPRGSGHDRPHPGQPQRPAVRRHRTGPRPCTDPTETVRPFGDDLLKLAFPGAALERVPHSYYAAAAEPWSIRWLHTIGDELPDLLAAIGLRLPRRGP